MSLAVIDTEGNVAEVLSPLGGLDHGVLGESWIDDVATAALRLR